MNVKAIVPVDYTPQLEESRTLITKSGDLLSAVFVSGLTRLAADVQDCEDVVKRVPDVSEKTLERTADFQKSVTAAINAADESRKKLTRPYDELKSLIKGLFDPGISRLEIVKSVIQAKLDNYYSKIDVARKAAEKAAAAGTAISQESAKALVVPLKATSDYGTNVGVQRKVSGELHDKRAFLAWAATQATDAELLKIDAKKSLLNDIAIAGDELVTAGEISKDEFESSTGITVKVEQKARVG